MVGTSTTGRPSSLRAAEMPSLVRARTGVTAALASSAALAGVGPRGASWLRAAGPRRRGHRNGPWGALCGVRPRRLRRPALAVFGPAPAACSPGLREQARVAGVALTVDSRAALTDGGRPGLAVGGGQPVDLVAEAVPLGHEV